MNDQLSLDTAAGPQAAPEVTASDEPKVRKVRTDHHLWGTYILLVIVALIELFSASLQEVSDGSIFDPVIRHGRFLAAGLVIMLILQHIHYRTIFRLIPFYVLGCFGLMIAVRVAGHGVNEAQRAITIFGTQILPADFMKVGAALGMAYILTKNQDEEHRDITVKGLVWSMVLIGGFAGLLFSEGLSNTIIVVAICYSMMLVGGMSWRKFGIALLIGAVAGGGALIAKTQLKEEVKLDPYKERVIMLNHENPDVARADGRGNVWRDRIKQHFRDDKHLEKFSVDHQQEQLSYIAQAHGGLFGVGIGRSRENARLPLAFSDYIYAIIIEELGLFVGLGILICYMWILGRSAKLTMRFSQTMPGVLVMGCAFVIVFQALYHMAIVTGVFPVSGQPLPLISKGGISVLAMSIAFGVMLSVARHAARISDTADEQQKELESLPEDARAVNPLLASDVEQNS